MNARRRPSCASDDLVLLMHCWTARHIFVPNALFHVKQCNALADCILESGMDRSIGPLAQTVPHVRKRAQSPQPRAIPMSQIPRKQSLDGRKSSFRNVLATSSVAPEAPAQRCSRR